MSVLSARAMQRLADILLANLSVVATMLATIAGAWLISSVTDNAIAKSAIPLFGGALAVTLAAVALHPELSWEGLGLGRATLPGLLWGSLIGFGAVAILVGLAAALGLAGWAPWDPAAIRFDWRAMPLAGLAVLAIGMAGEELFVRGLLLQFLARSITPAGAVAATSLAFALLHGANPGVTPLAQVNTALFGAVFGIAVVRQRSLWLAAGLHLGWNAAQAVLGSNTSGITIRLTDLNLEMRGAEWLSGGSYGLEGGAMASCTALAVGGAVWMLRGRSAAPGTFWERPVGDGTGADGPEPATDPALHPRDRDAAAPGGGEEADGGGPG